MINKTDTLEETQVLLEEDLVNSQPSETIAKGDIEDVVETLESLTTSDHLYTSSKTFEEMNLSPVLLKAVYALGYTKPSKIQSISLPFLLEGKSMIAQSQAGTGKTACFALGLLQRINGTTQRAVVLAPARELARQILDSIRELGKYSDVTTTLAVPGAIGRDELVDAQVIVGTPGTIAELIKRKRLLTKDVKIFVLDEADSMLDQQGLGDTSLRIKKLMPVGQVVLFSATFPEKVLAFAMKVAPGAEMIKLRPEELSVDGIKQFYMDCKDEEHKATTLCDLYGLMTIGQSIVFVRERRTADMLHQRMEEQGHKVASLHGNFEAADRDKAIDDFREGRSKVLITTNVLARGIDILQVNLVVNYDIPLDKYNKPDLETYVHRIGRTGRFGRQGVSINFVHDKTSFEEMKKIESDLGRTVTRVPTDNLVDIERILKDAL